MSSFLPVNSAPAFTPVKMDGTTATPKNSSSPHLDPSKTSSTQPSASLSSGTADHERDSGYGTVNGESEKRSISSPRVSNAASTGSPGRTHSREGSSVRSSVPEDNPGAESDADQEGGSENGAEMGESAPPSKKKKGQRFFCTDFPPCTLSFTRSEHLARHIRKHTGERPFQCHCSRRFSRLDNLRQHAQTVHVNEDIPGDSLAAQGTRFQRQIRTDRVRPPGRNRAGTVGSQGGHSRGHSRNLSTSSIGSTMSTYSQSQEIRRRPPPLMMAGDGAARTRLSLESMNEPPRTPPAQIHAFPTQSPSSALFTPASATYPAGDGGPYYYGSPSSATSGFWAERGSGRRLSFPSGTRPFEPTNTYPPAFPRPLAPSTSSYSNSGSIFGSPNAPHTPRDDSNMSSAEADWRRRTWHPSTHTGFGRPVSSGLWFNQPAERPQPGFGTNPPPRLPGIESFDQVQQRPSTPPRREPTPMQIDRPLTSSNAAPAFAPTFNTQLPTARPPPPISGPGHRRGHVSFDMSLHQNLTKLDIRGNTASNMDASHWSQQTIGELRDVASRPFGSFQRQPVEPTIHRIPDASRPPEQPATSSNSIGPTTPTQNKRHGWYNGPLPASTSTNQPANPSPEDSSSSEGVATPSASAPEYHPAIVPSHDDIERHHSHVQTEPPNNACAPQAPRAANNNSYPVHSNPESRHVFYSGNSNHPAGGMARLEALVAVATSEDKGAGRFI
ncbi:C2H2 transcription factor, variant 1 [Blastomyces dermatitidis ATCC 18188]|uniref:C2H2 transcription factor n=2 Tax=Ajellomyces dermatitidis (strain ATCC 18188 / CBS 674.68) TaxID=653446 RepID=F2TBC0_AJEDA|nr:C2H2 transcription factor [Blastomyces dermatitidis ATCC 18188]KMW67306.1 C2H2 transcription factor, variant 1 [Blastomyces dermatitidis ATCC 18188]